MAELEMWESTFQREYINDLHWNHTLPTYAVYVLYRLCDAITQEGSRGSIAHQTLLDDPKLWASRIAKAIRLLESVELIKIEGHDYDRVSYTLTHMGKRTKQRKGHTT